MNEKIIYDMYVSYIYLKPFLYFIYEVIVSLKNIL